MKQVLNQPSTGIPGIGSLLFLCLAFSYGAWADEAVERLFWDKVPLRITLPVDRERRVSFPGEVRVGIPVQLASQLRTQSNAGTVYWLAHAPFEPQRIEVRDLAGQGSVLIDLSAENDPDLPAPPLEIQFRQQPGGSEADPSTGSDAHQLSRRASAKTPTRAPGLVTLTRFAAQQLYAPARLLKAAPGIHRVSVSLKPISHLLKGAAITATPIAGWQSGRWYMTAVALNNTGAQFIELDPRHLRGQWRAATFQHSRLHPAGSEADTTAVYLISDRPFHEAL
ncbi:TIGR03749 family integrating conjugative element protein [Methylophaga sp.]|uniref:TIGR03749 family integrating conjugative element protein n=1 Tax=Methylophaga sp. TaxID=2024840 RepID=UPI002728D5AA|nr:TIGR03749 family integrating conjugative element protein [Methylophaga sp.]MDO8828252.1 TIGR03749 family integrating conjugative element protein [Methylophaga sp.]